MLTFATDWIWRSDCETDVRQRRPAFDENKYQISIGSRQATSTTMKRAIDGDADGHGVGSCLMMSTTMMSVQATDIQSDYWHSVRLQTFRLLTSPRTDIVVIVNWRCPFSAKIDDEEGVDEGDVATLLAMQHDWALIATW